MKKIILVLMAMVVFSFLFLVTKSEAADTEKLTKLVKYALEKGVMLRPDLVAVMKREETKENTTVAKILGVHFVVDVIKGNVTAVIMRVDVIEEKWTKTKDKDGEELSLIQQIMGADFAPIGTAERFINAVVLEDKYGKVLENKSSEIKPEDEWHQKWFDAAIEELYDHFFPPKSEKKIPDGVKWGI